VVPQKIVFSVLVPLGEQGLFYSLLLLSERRNTYVRSRQTMATPGKTHKPIQQSFDYQKGVFYYEKGYFSGSVRYDDAYHVRRMQGIRNC
jgi:hypothetical protein